ncbi:MAG: hypothetical protein VZS44_00315 [Bacilli bacterium]|nr:hypothetical protein [Bacilli bacterium]
MSKKKSIKNKIKNIGIVIFIMFIILGIIDIFDKISYVFEPSDNYNEEDVFANNNSGLKNYEIIEKGRYLYDKANDIFEVSALRPYCGFSVEELLSLRTTNFNYGDNNVVYYDSSYYSMDELEKVIKSVLNDELTKKVFNKKSITYDVSKLAHDRNFDYVMDKGKLYCRKHTFKGWVSSYLNHYDIRVKKISSTKIVYEIMSYYINDLGMENKKCINGGKNGKLNVNNCNKKEFDIESTKFIIEKNIDNDWVVNYFVLHD